MFVTAGLPNSPFFIFIFSDLAMTNYRQSLNGYIPTNSQRYLRKYIKRYRHKKDKARGKYRYTSNTHTLFSTSKCRVVARQQPDIKGLIQGILQIRYTSNTL